MVAGQKNRVGSFLSHLLNFDNCRVIAAIVKLAQNVQICILPLLEECKFGIEYKSTSVRETTKRVKWVLTGQYQLVASTRDTIDIILSIYNRICVVNPMSKLSNVEIIYVFLFRISPLCTLIEMVFSQFDADESHVTVRCIPQNVCCAKNIQCKKCI